MREISKNILQSKSEVEKLVGVRALIKISERHGKETLVYGKVDKLFPSVFTVRLDDGEVRTFSYSDEHTGGVLFSVE